MGVLKTLGIIILIIVVVIGAGIAYFIMPAKTAAAVLYIKQGAVEVKTNGEWGAAQNQIKLKLGDSVRTLDDGIASVIFYDSSVIRLDSGTSITIQNLESNSIYVKQETGKLWTKLLMLAGVETKFEVETPTTVATIRGTAFGTVIGADSTDIIVSQGIVKVKSYELKENVKNFLAEQDIKANEQAIILKNALDNVQKGVIQEKYTNWIREHKINDIDFLKELKISEIYKYKKIINLAKSRFGVTDEQVKDYIIQYMSEDEYKKEIEKYPVIPKKLIQRIDDINKEIKKLESGQ